MYGRYPSTALDMYDYVIAPTPEVAAAWRAPLPKNSASKIITLGLKPLTPFYDRGLEVLAGNVALCLPRVTHNDLEQSRYHNRNDVKSGRRATRYG